MGIWNWLFGGDMPPAAPNLNPATGLPMLGGISGVDVGGNPYGVDLTIYAVDSIFDVVSNFEAGWDPSAGIGNDWSS